MGCRDSFCPPRDEQTKLEMDDSLRENGNNEIPKYVMIIFSNIFK